MTRILVTGGSGFIGRPVLTALAARGDEVLALSSREQPRSIRGVRWCRLDLGEGDALEELVCELRPQQLLHLAWYVEHGRFWQASENVVWVERSLRLLRAFAQAGGQRAVMIGTCAEYDWRSAETPLHEASSPLVPATLYGAAKDSLRRLASAFADSRGLELAWARLFFLYGPGEPAERLVPSVIRSLLAGRPAATTLGTQRRDFMHVDDVAGALVALLHSSATGAVNVASGRAAAVSEVVDLIGAATGRPELLRRGAQPERPGEPPLIAADVRRLSQEVGYEPAWTLAGGIEDVVEWWRERAQQ